MNYPQLERAIETIRALHRPETGCPWDLQQSYASLLKYLIEEAYEYIEAVENKDIELMEEEIGDILLQVLHHTSISEKLGDFNLESVAKRMSDKIIHRHPHVFGKTQGEDLSADEVIRRWKIIKEEEKKKKDSPIPDKLLNLPSLMAAHKIGVASSKIKFDWEKAEDVLEKVEEEFSELKVELKKNQGKIKEELGDLFFSLAQLSRHLGFEAEDVLREANQKFIRRFRSVEELALEDNQKIESCSRDELEALWARAKKDEA